MSVLVKSAKADLTAHEANVSAHHIKTPRAVTLMLAASDSSAKSKAGADIVCDGINDHLDIIAAIAEIAATGGVIQLSEGKFHGSSFTIAGATYPQLVVVRGLGRATRYNFENTTDTITLSSLGCLEDLVVWAKDNHSVVAVDVVATGDWSSWYRPYSNLYVRCDTQTGKGVRIHAPNGMHAQFCTFGPLNILGFEYGFHLSKAGSGYVAACEHEQLTIAHSKYMVEIDNVGLDQNFLSIILEPLVAVTLTGIHVANDSTRILSAFYWDYNAPEVPLLIDAGVTNCDIMGWFPLITNNATAHANRILNLYRGELDVSQIKAKSVLFDDKEDYVASIPSLMNASVLLPFKEGAGTTTRDIASVESKLWTIENGVWTTMGRLGAITYNGTTTRVVSPYPPALDSIAMDGDRTIIIAVKPDFDYTENVQRGIAMWSQNGNGFYLYKKDNAGGNQISCRWLNTNDVSATTATPVPFAAGDLLIFTVKYINATGVLIIFCNGVLIAAVAGGATMPVDLGIMYAGYAGSYGWWSGDVGGPVVVIPAIVSDGEVSEISEQIADLIGLTHARLFGYGHQILLPIKLDLSAGAVDIEAHLATCAGSLVSASPIYTEASSGDAGVDVRIGRYQEGVALDDDYFYKFTSEINKAKGYTRNYSPGHFTKWKIAAGDTITIGTAGGKTGTGEILLLLRISEEEATR